MPLIKLYENIITRKHRPFSKVVLDNLLESLQKIECEVSGCYITNTSSYIDFEFNGDLSAYSKSYGFTETNELTYLFFIDRIEPNNFNEVKNYYRAFITVDWWSTILYNYGDEYVKNNIIYKVEGDVQRAHVNDIVKRNDLYYPTLTYTMDTPEESYSQVYTDGFLIRGFNDIIDTPSSILWHYVLFSFSDLSENEIYSQFLNGLRSGVVHATPAPCGVAFMPVRNGITLPIEIPYTDTDGSTKGYIFDTKLPLSVISDPRVIHSFISTIPPCDYSYNEDSGRVVLLGWKRTNNYDPIVSFIKSQIGEVVLSLPSIFGNVDLPILSVIEGAKINIPRWVNSTSYKLPHKITNSGEIFQKPLTYDDYHKLAVKARSEVYNKTFIYCNGEAYEVPISYSYEFTLSIDFETGGVFICNPVINSLSDFMHNKRVGLDATFEPYKKVDRLKIFQGVLGGALNSASTALKSNGKNTLSNVGGYIGGTASGLSAIIDMAIQSRGVVSSQPSGQSQENGVGLCEFIVSQPVGLESVIEHLEFYGYNTIVRLDVILTKHLRNYYNYVKMYSCDLTSSIFPEDVRLSIEEMFNNGVWLWHKNNMLADDCADGVERTNSIGYLWLNNYPLVFDE